jgi:hypothetical protein
VHITPVDTMYHAYCCTAADQPKAVRSSSSRCRHAGSVVSCAFGQDVQMSSVE